MADAKKNVFDELFVISDLHLGGEEEPTLFAAGSEFKNWMNRTVLPRCGDQRHVGLVINGDMFDFLAERGARYFDPLAARGAVSRIAADPRYKPVFDQLKTFLDRPNTRLAITLGNHDLELCDSGVRGAVESVLKQTANSNSRIAWALESQGYSCRVGSKRVLCRHGNEGDPDNQVHRERLDRALKTAGNPTKGVSWIPNTGTHIVIDIVNPLHEMFPFVQVLKPEDHKLVLLVLIISPSQLKRLPQVASVLYEALKARLGLLADALVDTSRKPRRRISRREIQLLAQGLVLSSSTAAGAGSLQDTTELLRVAHEQVELTWREMERQRGRLAAGIVQEQPESPWERWNRRRQRLAFYDAFKAAISLSDRTEILRNYLKSTTPDRQFDERDRTDRVYQFFCHQPPPNVDYLLTGHTHHKRNNLPLGDNTRYFNTGTWARVMRIPQQVVTDPIQFCKLSCMLRQEHNKELFANKQFVQSPCDYLHLHSNGSEVIAELKQAN